MIPQQHFNLINNKKYAFNIALLTSNGRSIPIPYNIVDSLVLDENIDNPFTIGHIVINDPNDIIELTTAEGYIPRNDGRDYILIQFSPYYTDTIHCLGQQLTIDNTSIEKYLKYEFVGIIETSKPIIDTTSNTKKWMMTFVSDKYYKLVETKNKKSYQMQPGVVDSDNVSENIKTILISTFGDNIVDTRLGKWTKGDAKIDYTPSILDRQLQSLLYLLKHDYIIAGEDVGVKMILDYDRYTSRFSYIPFHTLFQEGFKSGVLNTNGCFIEKITQGGSVGTENPIDKVLSNFKLDGPTSLVNNASITYPSSEHTYDFCNTILANEHIPGKRGVVQKKVELPQMRDKFTKLFIDNGIRNIFPQAQPYIVLHKNKIDDNVKVINTVHEGICERLAQSQLISSLILLAPMIKIQVEGMPFRTPGTFFDFTRFIPTDKPDNIIDKVVNGRWLITSVTHTFTYGSYINTITGVKPYINSKVEFTEE